MAATEAAFVVLCGIGTANSLFLAAHLLRTGKGEEAPNRLLAALILTFSVRVAKAVVMLFAGHLHPLFEWVWIAALGMTGVAALLYVRCLVPGRVVAQGRWLAVLATSVLLGARLVTALPLNVTWRVMAAALVVYAASVGAAGWLSRLDRAIEPLLHRWLLSLLTFLASIWTLYVTLILTALFRRPREESFFQVEAILFSVATYGIVYLELRNGLVSRLHSARRERVDLNDPMLQRLRRVVEGDRLFLDPSLSLPALARVLRLTPQHVSRLINAGIGSSFNDYVNRLRVEEACRILSGPTGASKKIGSVPYDCGFGSPSVFYAAFRKFTGQTPAEYQRKSVQAQEPL